MLYIYSTFRGALATLVVCCLPEQAPVGIPLDLKMVDRLVVINEPFELSSILCPVHFQYNLANSQYMWDIAGEIFAKRIKVA